MTNSIAGKTFALFDNPTGVKLIAEIEKTGAKLLKFPIIETEKIELSETSIELIKNLKNFNWIIFPDVLAVDYFLAGLEENGVDFFELDEVRVCALGEVVSDRLRFVQLHADVIPNLIGAENIVSSLKNYTAEDELKKMKFLIVKEISLDNAIRNELIKSRAEVTELPVYRIKPAVKNETAKLKTLLITLFRGGAIDEFIFSAPTDFIALKNTFNEELFAELFSEIKVSAVDGLTLQIVREHDLKRADLFRLEKIDTV